MSRIERCCAWLGLSLVAGVAAAIWWHNHDILSDLYDYSSVIAAAGKIEAGLKPYVDFRSTMQSSTYLLNRGVEIVAGRSYLGLVTGGLAVSVVGAVALFSLWWRSYGVAGGLMLAAAVVWSGLSQHVVVFYNPVGILCLGIVVAGVARSPRLWPLWQWDRALVIGALFLGGINKVNFQFHGLALAAVLVLYARVTQRIQGRDTVASLLVLAVAGIVFPLGFELAWTGATPAQWYENVVGLSTERVDYIRRLADPIVYAGPAHGLHYHIPFKRLTALGLVLLAVVLGLAWRNAWREAAPGWPRFLRLALLGTYGIGAALGGVLLTITNVETIALTSLAFVIAAAGLWVAAVRPNGPGAGWPRLGWLLPAAGLFWAVDGGIAAWKGSRVLFAREHIDRNVFVRLQDAPPELRYFEGVRLDAELHRTLLLVARELAQLKSSRQDLSGVLFGSAFEWLERAYPETILKGMPVWYHVGTALREDDGDWLAGRLASHRVDRILAHPGWESWPGGFRQRLDREYRSVAIGGMARFYEKMGTEQHSLAAKSFQAGEPLTMVERTGSNLHLVGSPAPEGFAFSTSPWGDYLEGAGAWEWNWCAGPFIVEGVVVANREGATATPARFTVSATTGGAGEPREELWRAPVEIAAGQSWVRLPFRITPYGKPVRFKVVPEATDAAQLKVGLRAVRISQTSDSVAEPPPPTTVSAPGCYVKLPDGTTALFRAADPLRCDQQSWQAGPIEAWARRDSGTTPWSVTLEVDPTADGQGTPPIVMLFCYRGGRVDLLSQQAIATGTSGEITFGGWMSETSGWLGVAVRATEHGKPFSSLVRVKGWSWQEGPRSKAGERNTDTIAAVR